MRHHYLLWRRGHSDSEFLSSNRREGTNKLDTRFAGIQ